MVKPSAKASGKPRALSLHIGLNAVDPKHYAGWSGPLAACEFDANDMAAIAKAQGMTATRLLTKAGTRKAVLAGIRNAAAKLARGDLFFLSYSGHGGQVPDSTSAPDEPDKKDETWCLYDGQLIDDELYFELGRFAAGVRILVLARAAANPSLKGEDLAAFSAAGGAEKKACAEIVALLEGFAWPAGGDVRRRAPMCVPAARSAEFPRHQPERQHA